MRISRKELLAALLPLKPALAGERTVIVAQKQIWFDGHYAYAHSNSFGVRSAVDDLVPAWLDFGVPGKLLLDLLTKSKPDSVELEMCGDAGVKLIANVSSVTLPTMGKKHRPRFYDRPEGEAIATLTVSDDLINGMKSVLILKPSKVRRLEHRGISIFSVKHGSDLYTSDSKSIALAEIDEHFALPRAVLLRSFAEQVIKQCDKGAVIEFYKDQIRVRATTSLTLFANVLDPRGLVDLPDYADRCCDPKLAPPFRIPDGFDAFLEHAMITAGTEEPVLKLQTSGYSLTASAKFNGSVIEQGFDVERDLPRRTISVLLTKPLMKVKADRLMISHDAVAWCGKHSFFFLPSH